MSITWSFLPETDQLVEGQWLSGCAAMWKTELARAVRFNEGFSGYSNSEDLDFSLRIGAHGRIIKCGEAIAHHLHEPGGRPNAYQMGYWTTRNLHHIHCTCLPQRRWWDACWFYYAFAMDALIRTVGLILPGQVAERFQFVRGRWTAVLELLLRRFVPKGTKRQPVADDRPAK
jgi:GT2 family glycosyltransferase